MDIYLFCEIFYGKVYVSMYSNFIFVTIYDFYDGCGSKFETYKLMVVFFCIDYFWVELIFWAFVVYVGVVPLGLDNVIYYVDINFLW